MKNFDVVLKIVEYSTDSDKLIRAKRLMEALSERELNQDIPNSDFEDLVSTHDTEKLFRKLSSENPESCLDEMDREISKIPKKYDIALYLSSKGAFNEAHELMEELIEDGETKDFMDL